MFFEISSSSETRISQESKRRRQEQARSFKDNALRIFLPKSQSSKKQWR